MGFFSVIKCALSRKLVIWYILTLIYFIGMIIILIKCGFWEKRLLKDTVIWFITTGLISCGKAIGKAKDAEYFKEQIKNNFKLIVILQFVLNLYTFSFIVEVILMLVMTILSVCIVILDIKEEFKNESGRKLKRLLNIIQSFIVLLILYYSIREIIINIGNIIIIDKIKDVALPIILSSMFIIYIYLFCIYSSYEQLFIKLSFKRTIDDKIRFFLKVRVIIFCNINIKRINCFIERSNIMRSYVRNKKEVQDLIYNYKSFSIDKENNGIII